MKRLVITCLAIVGLVSLLQADEWNKKTELTVNQTIQVPGATLTPGKYVVKLVDSQANRHIVQFLNERQDKVISTVLAIPNERLEPTGESEFSFYEGTSGAAPVLRAWFYPGDNLGQQFAYPAGQAQELATASGEEVPAYSGEDMNSAKVTTVSPNESETKAADNEQQTAAANRVQPEAPARTHPARSTEEQSEKTDPTLMAQARQPRQQPQTPRQQATPPAQQPPAQNAAGQAESSQRDLPATASPAPLLGLIGFLSLGAAVGLRRLSKQNSTVD